MKRIGSFVTTISLLSALFISVSLLTGCEEEGPAERAGEKLDNAAEKTGEELEKAGDEVKDAVENPG